VLRLCRRLRKAIADASRKRWAAIKAGQTSSTPVVERKREPSAAARKAMANVAKKRWAAIKAGKAESVSEKAKQESGIGYKMAEPNW
jgi:hypothetical protein